MTRDEAEALKAVTDLGAELQFVRGENKRLLDENAFLRNMLLVREAQQKAPAPTEGWRWVP